MSRILKWDVPVDDQEHLIGAGPIVHIDNQYESSTSLTVWTHEDEDAAKKPLRRVQVYRTGHQIKDPAVALGSVKLYGGVLMWHLIQHCDEVTPEDD